MRVLIGAENLSPCTNEDPWTEKFATTCCQFAKGKKLKETSTLSDGPD